MCFKQFQKSLVKGDCLTHLSSNPDLTRVNPLFISWLTLGRLKPLVEKWIFVTFVAKSPIVRQYDFSSEQFKSRSSITFPFLVFQSVVLSLDDTVSVTVLDGVLYRVHVI